MELDGIRIENFQCHEKRALRFRENVTVIVGKTDAGKSAIIRALRWVLTNRPQGDAHIREGADYCRVQIKLGDKVITRERGKSANTYNMDGEEFKSFSNAVPDTIQNHSRVTDINFQGQHDAPFWFTLSPGEVGKHLNAIVDLEVIDNIVTATKRRAMTVKSKLSVIEDEQKTVASDVARLSFVPDMCEQWERVVLWQGRFNTTLAKQLLLQEKLDAIGVLQEDVRSKTILCAVLSVIAQRAEASELAKKRCQQLRDRITQLEEIQSLANREVPDMKALRTLQAQSDTLRVRVNALRDSLRLIETTESNRNIVERALRQAEEELGEIRTCPTCSRPL